ASKKQRDPDGEKRGKPLDPTNHPDSIPTSKAPKATNASESEGATGESGEEDGSEEWEATCYSLESAEGRRPPNRVEGIDSRPVRLDLRRMTRMLQGSILDFPSQADFWCLISGGPGKEVDSREYSAEQEDGESGNPNPIVKGQPS
ncbi:hypothetical protein U1Q18_027827, partial [Sarracenia purpurea var. burkii]